MMSLPMEKLFERVFIEEPARGSLAAQRALEIFPRQRIQFVREGGFPKMPQLSRISGDGPSGDGPLGGGPFRPGRLSAEAVSAAKKTLLLKEFKGAFFKRCPGASPKLMCCNYYVLNLGQNCEMDCSYCYLQSFINFPAVVVYTNIEKALSELEALRRAHGRRPIRVGTGEQADSLSLDSLSLHSRRLVRFFKSCPSWLLEFKTKSHNIQNFENESHAGNVIVSWSLNPEFVIQKEEHGTSSLKQRLAAARRARDKGFKVSFHIDPLIFHQGWRESCSGLVRQIAGMFAPGEIFRLSLGALRFQPEQRALMRKRFGMESLVCRGEFFRGRDGKLRYDSQLRRDMFQFLIREFKRRGHDEGNLFLCMETPENWLGALSAPPKKIPRLKGEFDLRLIRQIESGKSSQ